MAHTNRHYRFFFRQLSQRAHIYTEMMPSAQIVQVFELAVKASAPTSYGNFMIPYEDPESMQELAHRLYQYQKNHPSALYSEANAGYFAERNLLLYNILQELMAPMNEYHADPIVLQLGGRNPETLGKATAIAMAFGYKQINLNCGCPSSSVATGNQAGAALMLEPALVAECLEAMSNAMSYYKQDNGNTVALSLKHRLGVAFANEYDAAWDHQQNDEAAYKSCHEFLKVIASSNTMVSKVQVHARLALLGIGDTNNDIYTTNGGMDRDEEVEEEVPKTKVNHKRAQYFAKREARQATIKNRSVPPLRPKVVEQIAQEFGDRWEVLSNGGIKSMSDISDRLQRKEVGNGDEASKMENLWQGQVVTGAMVGRAAINHPCSFATVDSVLWGIKSDENRPTKTRQQVLETYMEYCEAQEALIQATFPSTSPGGWQFIRKQLVAVPFHLFMGEEGNNAYQRRLRKLSGRGQRYSANGMLDAAAREVPDKSLTKRVEEHTPWTNIEQFEFTKRSGSMQRTIYR